jgi:hypothetical protein
MPVTSVAQIDHMMMEAELHHALVGNDFSLNVNRYLMA